MFSDVHIPGTVNKKTSSWDVSVSILGAGGREAGSYRRHALAHIHTHTHAHIHIYIHIYTYTYIHTYVRRYILNPFGRKCFNRICPYCYTYLKYCVVFSDVHIPGTVNKKTSSWDVSVSILGAGGREAGSYRRHALAHIHTHTHTHAHIHIYIHIYTYIRT